MLGALLAAGAAVALLALASLDSPRTRAGGAPPAPPAPPVTDDGGAGLIKAGAGAGAAALGGGALGAAAVAWVAANTALGAGLTGDVAGAVAGGLLGPMGNAGNVGRVGGKSLDEALGGSRDTAVSRAAGVAGVTDTTAQVGGFLVGTSWWIFGAAAGLTAILSVFLPVYLLVSAITDAVRLAFGQKGARDAYRAQWVETEARYFQSLRSQVDPLSSTLNRRATAWSSDDAVRRFSWALADGYCRATNRLGFRRWMRGPRGVGLAPAAHGLFGQERGYFCGAYFAGDSEVPGQEPALESWSPAYVELIRSTGGAATLPVAYEDLRAYRWKLRLKDDVLPAGTVRTFGDSRRVAPAWLASYPWEQSEADALLRGGANAAPSTFREPGGLTDLVVSSWFDVLWLPVTRPTSSLRDFLGPELVLAGQHAANLDAWKLWMLQPHGAFREDVSHAQFGQAGGVFWGVVEGSYGGPATLLYEGRRFDKDGVALEPAATVAA